MKKYIKITAAVLFIFTGILLFANLTSNAKTSDFKKNGVEVVAKINYVSEREILKTSEGNEFTSYIEVNFFTRETNRLITAKIPVKTAHLYKFKKGYKLKIFYLQQNPHKAVLKEYFD